MAKILCLKSKNPSASAAKKAAESPAKSVKATDEKGEEPELPKDMAEAKQICVSDIERGTDEAKALG